MEIKEQLNAAEAVMGFAAWLTSQDQPITMSSKHNAAPACEAVALFLETNGFSQSEIRDHYHKILKHPARPIKYAPIIKQNHMKAIVLAFTLKGQDKDKIIAAVRALKDEYGDYICIHGFMPRNLVLAKNFSTEVVDAIEETFPIRLNMHNGKDVLRTEMADIAAKLAANVIVIGEVKEGVYEEMELHLARRSANWNPIRILI